MKKLNNKGITTIEVLVCFVLVVTITVSIYTTVSGFNERKTLESYKEKIYSYKNLLTKEMQDDFIKIGLKEAKYTKSYETVCRQYDSETGECTSDTAKSEKIIHTVDCLLQDGTKRRLVVEQLYAVSQYHLGGSLYFDDYFMIRYGTPENDMIDWDLPELGYSGYLATSSTHKECDVDLNRDVGDCRKVLDFSINNVNINVVGDDILSIYIGFYHPEFGTRYAIDITAPINFIPSGYESTSVWKD